MDLTHIDEKGKARMVDVSHKPKITRTAKAFGKIILQSPTIDLVKNNSLTKGDVLAVARVAGIMAAKRADELIPLCHSLNTEQIGLDFNFVSDGIEIISQVKLIGKTGVEMEALTSVSVAALTIYDMCKAVDKNMKIKDIHLLEKNKSQYFKVLSVNVSAHKGEVKIPVSAITLKENFGIEGDAHAGDGLRQVSLLAIEDMQHSKISFGSFAENITTSGIDIAALPIGARLYLGEAVLEITQIGKECHGECAIRKKIGDCAMPRRGVFAKVIKGGVITSGSDGYYYF
jgi:cyclic pyranopterin phosphate synthase